MKGNVKNTIAKIKKEKTGKLFIFVAGVIASIMVVMNVSQALIVAGLTKTDVRNDSIEQNSHLASVYSKLMTKTCAENFAFLDFYTSSDVVDSGDTETIVDWLLTTTDSRERVFDYVAWVDKDGGFYSDTGNVTNVSERDYFKGIMLEGNNTFIDNPVTSKTTGKTVVHVCKAAKVNGSTIGFFCGVAQIQELTNFLSSLKLPGRGYASLIASTGSVFVSTAGDAELKANIEVLGGRLEEIVRDTASGNSGNFWLKNKRGANRLYIYEPVESTPWTLLISLEQSVIERVANKVRNLMGLGTLFSSGGVCVVLILVLMAALRPLKIVERSIANIASGDADLTKRIDIESNNEIGRVVDGFNNFAAKLQSIVKAMKESKEQLLNAGQLLHDSTEDTTSSIAQIIGHIESMDKQITAQTESVHSTAGAVNQIASNIESLNRMIDAQSSSVTQASVAVEQMIGNINSVTASVQKMAASFSELERKASIGVQTQNDVNAKIAEIVSESQALQEANTVISGIAEQTNLLAMNAAIEAAHAGEAGKGFSVVADEIRKLSEDSSSQSQTIGQQLSRITGSIEQIVSASQVAQDAFNEVSGGINATNNLVQEITNAMFEQNEGSKLISKALGSMNDTSDEVKTASFEMAEGNKAILDEIKVLQEATFSIKDGMDEMSSGARRINETGAALSELSRQMDESINNIGVQVDKFKV
jgi:methyl-accepting chemotaxis protein